MALLYDPQKAEDYTFMAALYRLPEQKPTRIVRKIKSSVCRHLLTSAQSATNWKLIRQAKKKVVSAGVRNSSLIVGTLKMSGIDCRIEN